MTTNKHSIDYDLLKELFKPTAVEIGYAAFVDNEGKWHTIYPIKKGENK